MLTFSRISNEISFCNGNQMEGKNVKNKSEFPS
jgi:hypothetical protein